MSVRSKLPTARGFPSIQEILAAGFPESSKKNAKTSLVSLGLDLSSSCIGWSVGLNKTIVSYGKLVFTEGRDMGDKLVETEKYFSALLTNFPVDRVLCEKPATRSGNTTSLHNQILGVIRLVAFRQLGIEILPSHLIAATTIKRLVGVPRGSSYDERKQIMCNKISEILGVTLTYDKNSKFHSSDDIADACAVLVASWNM